MIMPFSWKEETTKIGTRYLQEIKYKMFVELLGNNTPMTIYSETQVDTWINRQIWDKAFKSRTSKVCERQPLKILLGPFLNTLSHIPFITLAFSSIKVLRD